jgi:hypothetical protein
VQDTLSGYGLGHFEMQETEYGFIALNDGIFYYVYNPGLVIDLQIARETVKHRKQLCGDQKVLGVAWAWGIKKVTPKARAYLNKSTEAAEGIKAVALVIDMKSWQLIAARFYIKWFPPDYEMFIFNDPVNAVKWLKLWQSN